MRYVFKLCKFNLFKPFPINISLAVLTPFSPVGLLFVRDVTRLLLPIEDIALLVEVQ